MSPHAPEPMRTSALPGGREIKGKGLGLAPLQFQKHSKSAGQSDNRRRLRNNFGDAEPDVVVPARRVAAVANRSLEVDVVVVERTTTQATIGVSRVLITYSLVPLPDVAPLVECAVRAVGVLELPGDRGLLTGIDGVRCSVIVGVVAGGVGHVPARGRVAARGVVPVCIGCAAFVIRRLVPFVFARHRPLPTGFSLDGAAVIAVVAADGIGPRPRWSGRSAILWAGRCEAGSRIGMSPSSSRGSPACSPSHLPRCKYSCRSCRCA